MWSVRVRASRGEIHISGAEGIFDVTEIKDVVGSYIDRVYSHSRGEPDRVVITLEELKESPRPLTALPLLTVDTKDRNNAWVFIERALVDMIGVSPKAYECALEVINSDLTMRGAAIVGINTGSRFDPDPVRGVRASRLGISSAAMKELSEKLNALELNTTVVSEALVLATKVASHEGVVAELCVSDDPDYTTGYVASRKGGYMRVPFIKEEGDHRGGRVIFVSEDTDVDDLISYLQSEPVLVNKISEFKGLLSPDEAISAFDN